MTNTPALPLVLLAVLAMALFPGSAKAQDSAEACTDYETCALRINWGGGFFARASIVQGTNNNEIADYGRSDALRTLFSVNESALAHYERFEQNDKRASAWSWSGAILLAAGLVASSQDSTRDHWFPALSIAGLTATVVSTFPQRAALNAMSQAVWEYNRGMR